MKVAIVTYALEVGGVETVIKNCSMAFDTKDFIAILLRQIEREFLKDVFA